MSLNARSIALQGFGFGSRHIAQQGLVPTAVASPGGRRFRLPRELVDSQRMRAIDEDDSLLLIASALIAGAGVLH